MSVWAQAQQLSTPMLHEVKSLYQQHFPIEVRHYLADWIEDKMWPLMDREPEPNLCAEFFQSLMHQIQVKAESMNQNEMFVNKLKLVEAAKQLNITYADSPFYLFNFLQNSLKREIELINSINNYVPQEMPMNELKYSELINGLRNVDISVSQANEELKYIETQQEMFLLQYHECTKSKATLEYYKKQPPSEDRRQTEVAFREKIEKSEQALSTLATQMMRAQLSVTEKLKDNIMTLNKLQSRVLDEELSRWRREQQLNGNGAPPTTDLNTIQTWCEELARLIWNTRQQVKDLARGAQFEYVVTPTVRDRVVMMDTEVTGLLSALVKATFIIEKQPPQVMKTNTRFTSTVRLLVGGQLNVHMNPPQVIVTIISEVQAQELMSNNPNSCTPRESGTIINNKCTMEYHAATKSLSVSFRNMQLRNIKRAEKKGTESVMDEKLTLFFQCRFQVGGEDGVLFQVWTLSLPVVVIVHGNQEPHGWATVTWDNAFASPNRMPFAVPETVPWAQMAETLNLKFASATGRPLSDSNLRFLAEKIFKSPVPLSDSDLANATVSWTQFCKETLPDRSFTFWEWFYMVMKVTRDFLRDPWKDGLIMGFIQKKQAEKILSVCQPGTFLLRFSDSELGGITIAWVRRQNVLSVEPFTSKALQFRGIADRVRDISEIMYLYKENGVHEPKHHVFQKYYTAADKTTVITDKGYVKPELVCNLPSLDQPDDGSNSPNYNFQTPDPRVRGFCYLIHQRAD